jgi:hypothetical protein
MLDSINFSSKYKKYSSQEIKWIEADSLEHFQFNLKNRYEDLHRLGWLDKNVTYKFNSLGFRCEEFSDQPSAMFLGCSMTVGIGLPVEETWANIVSTSLKLQCINLAAGGNSPDTAFRMCLGYIDKIKPKIVIYNQPPEGRIELVNFREIENLILKDFSIDTLDPYLKKYVISPSNLNLNYLKNYFAIKLLCLERNIKFIIFDDNVLTGCCMGDQTDLARDLVHPGTGRNKDFASYVLSNI